MIMLSNQARGCGSDLSDSERIYKPRQRDCSARIYRIKQILYRFFAPAFAVFKMKAVCGRKQIITAAVFLFQQKDVYRIFYDFITIKVFNYFCAEAFNIKCLA